ncbi:MAG: PEP-utilizing enzyme [Nanoarchaeota archaeon]|nr:PEP-utilizing enzyme [Nanoarchaeota archaeon]
MKNNNVKINYPNLFQKSTRQRMSPFPNYYSMECVSKEMKKCLGICYERTILLIFKENLMYVFFDKKDSDKVEDYSFKKIMRNPLFFHKIVGFVDKAGKEFVDWAKKASKNPEKYTNKQLANLQEEYEKKYKFVYSHYFTILTVEGKLSSYLKEYLRSKIKDGKNCDDCFNILITEPRAQVNGMENYAALKLAKKIVENKKWKSHFEGKSENSEDLKKIEILVKNDSKLNKLFENHEKSFFWITRDYEDPALAYSDFVKRMLILLEKNPASELKKKKKYLESAAKEIKKIEKKYKIDKKHSRLFSAMREGIHLKELRKAYVSQSLFYFESVSKEIAKRSDVSLRAIRHLKTDEVVQIFDNKKLQDELSERVKLSVYHTEKGKTEVCSGKRAEEIYNVLLKTDGENLTELKGFSASPGKAEGPVIIIMNPDELYKVQKGDILVTHQTVPSFGPVFKKIAGLVCDGGTGITSHPAIMSREAKIPCITGAKVATQVLKNGEIVELDAYKGILTRKKKA